MSQTQAEKASEEVEPQGERVPCHCQSYLRGTEHAALGSARWLGRDVAARATDGLSLAFTASEAELLRERSRVRREAGAPIDRPTLVPHALVAKVAVAGVAVPGGGVRECRPLLEDELGGVVLGDDALCNPAILDAVLVGDVVHDVEHRVLEDRP